MTNCGYCGHPGIHAQVLPPRGAPRGRCPTCSFCQREIEEESAEAAAGGQAQKAEGDAE